MPSSLQKNSPVDPGCSNNAPSRGAPPPRSFQICAFSTSPCTSDFDTQTKPSMEGFASPTVVISPRDTKPSGAIGCHTCNGPRLARNWLQAFLNLTGARTTSVPAPGRITNVPWCGLLCPLAAVWPNNLQPSGSIGFHTETSCLAPEPLSFQTNS